jgi:hypothetical protein
MLLQSIAPFRIRDLIPCRSCRLDAGSSVDDFTEGLRAKIIPKSFWHVVSNKGQYIGDVSRDRFRICRYTGRMYMPVALGRVHKVRGRCEFSVHFVAVEGLVLPTMLLAMIVIACVSRSFAGAIAMGVFLMICHIPGCVNFKSEVDEFFEIVPRGAGNDSGVEGSPS